MLALAEKTKTVPMAIKEIATIAIRLATTLFLAGPVISRLFTHLIFRRRQAELYTHLLIYFRLSRANPSKNYFSMNSGKL
jgi:hypothetical protein